MHTAKFFSTFGAVEGFDCLQPQIKNAKYSTASSQGKQLSYFYQVTVNPNKSIEQMSYFFTSESVSEGHPDKVADQISDAIIDNFLAFDPQSKVACETLVTTGQVVLAGEVKSSAYLDVQSITREV